MRVTSLLIFRHYVKRVEIIMEKNNKVTSINQLQISQILRYSFADMELPEWTSMHLIAGLSRINAGKAGPLYV